MFCIQRNILAVLLLGTALSGRAQEIKDTVISGHKISYNHFTVYGNPINLDKTRTVLSIGIMKNDSVPNGNWYYFYPSGKLLAKGRYDDGYKKGTWTYYPLKKPEVKVKWEKEHQLQSEIIFDENNDPVIKDVTGKGLEHFNGRVRNTYIHSRIYQGK